MKRFISIISIAALLCCFAACNKGSEQDAAASAGPGTAPVTDAAQATPEPAVTPVPDFPAVTPCGRFGCGIYYGAVVKEDGTLWMWGGDEYGELANKDLADRTSPVQIMEDVKAVYCNQYAVAAIKNDDTLWTWGWAVNGQLGDGGKSDAKGLNDLPIRVKPAKILDDVVTVSGTCYRFAAVTKDGSLWMWGDFSCYIDGTFYGPSDTPVKVMDGVIDVDLSSAYAIIKEDHSLWMWGDDDCGQFGSGTTGAADSPIKIMDNVAKVSCGGSHTAILTLDGELLVCGDNSYGQLGTALAHNDVGWGGNGEIQTVALKLMEDVSDVCCGTYTTFIIKKDGTLWACGTNELAELGDYEAHDTERYSEAIQTVPVKIMDNVAAVDIGHWVGIAVMADGSVRFWGAVSHGAGNGTTGNFTDEHGRALQTVPCEVMPAGSVMIP